MRVQLYNGITEIDIEDRRLFIDFLPLLITALKALGYTEEALIRELKSEKEK